ncbi:MAG: hypothetical protein ACYTGG_12955 [Planctomycetota bacterium]|jgi:hypothetical protein
MRILTVGLSVLAAGLLLASPGSASTARADAPAMASGSGPATFQEIHHDERDDDGGEGIGFLIFDVSKSSDGISGSLLFAGEHHHGLYPDIVVRLSNIRRATFGTNEVTFSGTGTYHTTEATIVATARDGDPSGELDVFTVRVRDRSGHVLFDAKGRLTGGDIQIGPVD